jgi:hypothetical protein
MCTVDSRYYDTCYNEILLITIPNLYPNHSQSVEISTGYIESGYIDTFSLSHQYRNNESLLHPVNLKTVLALKSNLYDGKEPLVSLM